MTVTPELFNLVGGVFLFLFGASIGSFLNVVAYRVPRRLSVVLPKSRCPKCSAPISPLGLIPVFGYLLLGGRCRSCKEKISWHYPAVEALTGLLTVFTVFQFFTPADLYGQIVGMSIDGGPVLGSFRFAGHVGMFSALWLLYTGVALSLIDLEFRILPDVITLPGILVGLALGSANPWIGWQSSLGGAVLGAGSLYALAKGYEWIRKREGMGMGDVKYLGFIGAVVGWQNTIWVIAIGSMAGTVVGLALAFRSKEGLTTALPFGPFLAFGAYVVSLWGNRISEIYYGG